LFVESVQVNHASLLEEARRGGEEAFLTLYSQHRNAVFRFAFHMTGSIATAEDVTQECFLAMVRGSEFDPCKARLQAWLFGIARHIVFRHLRISGHESEQLAETATTADALDEILSAERSEMVRQAIASLPALQREAILLFEYDELSLEEVATVTGADVGAIKARLRRARESLRKRLGPLLRHKTEGSCS